MTQQDKIKKLATEVMGWFHDAELGGNYWTSTERDARLTEFDPYRDSADNDALIEAYLKQCGTSLEIIPHYGLDRMEVFIWDGCEPWVQITREPPYTTAKKNEAVCEAILQAIEGGE